MPTIPGGNLVDASGNQLQDAGLSPLGEAALQVAVVAGGFVISIASGGTIDPELAAGGLEWYLGLLKILFPKGTQGVNVLDLLGSIQQDIWDVQTALSTANLHVEYISGSQTYNLEQVLAAITGISTGGGLTTDEHNILVGLPSGSAIATQVWNYVIELPPPMGPGNGWQASLYLLHTINFLAVQAWFQGIPVPDRAYWRFCSYNPNDPAAHLSFPTDAEANIYVPVLDLSLVQRGDTLMGYLAREYPNFNYHSGGFPGFTTGENVTVTVSGWGYVAFYRCTLTDADIQALWPPEPIDLGTLTVPSGAPVWPGVDNVTLGETVTLTPNLHIVAPMDGVLVTITTPPSRSGMYEVGGAILDYGQGRVTFETDNGELEPWQYTGFRSAIYTPKTMAHAAGVRFQVLAGASGTVTPWSVSS